MRSIPWRISKDGPIPNHVNGDVSLKTRQRLAESWRIWWQMEQYSRRIWGQSKTEITRAARCGSPWPFRPIKKSWLDLVVLSSLTAAHFCLAYWDMLLSRFDRYGPFRCVDSVQKSSCEYVVSVQSTVAGDRWRPAKIRLIISSQEMEMDWLSTE